MAKSTANTPPPPRQAAPNRPAPPVPKVAFGQIPENTGHRIVLFGAGGIGKTTLAAMAPGPVAFFDLDDSLSRLREQLPDGVDVRPVESITGWADIRKALHAEGWDEIRTLVIDSATKAEELAVAHTLATVPHEKGHRVDRIEGYGFGKGYAHVYETFLALLGDLDVHTRAGRHVVLICHDCTAKVPNPVEEDWIRYEPRLQSPSSGKASIRLRVREWADHVLFVGYDITVKNGKGIGSGTRTIYPNELPHCMAKSRTLAEPMPFPKHDTTLWTRLFGASAE
jgi:hypothetical protein